MTEMPPAFTPEAAFEMYRTLVEDNAQAVPILMAISEKGINAYTMEVDDDGIQPVLVDIAMKMLKQHDLPLVVMLTSEAWARGYEGEADPRIDPRPETSLDEAVIIAYADRAGNNWTAMRLFVRTNEGVRWRDDLIEEAAEVGGPVTDILNAMVGRLDKVKNNTTKGRDGS